MASKVKFKSIQFNLKHPQRHTKAIILVVNCQKLVLYLVLWLVLLFGVVVDVVVGVVVRVGFKRGAARVIG